MSVPALERLVGSVANNNHGYTKASSTPPLGCDTEEARGELRLTYRVSAT